MQRNNLSKTIAAVALIASALLPFSAMAAETTTGEGSRGEVRVEGVATKVAVNFCARITAKDGIRAELSNRLSDLEKFRTERDSRMKTRTDDRRQNLSDKRQEHDTDRTDRYTKLSVLAKTDAQKKAIADFQASVDAATAARRVAVDAANTTFETALKQALTDREAKVNAVVATFKASMDSALNKAKADCTAGISAVTVRASFQAAVTAAQLKEKTDRQAVERFDAIVKALVDTRRTAVETAHAAFQTSVEAARVKLKAALKAGN